MSRPVVDDAMLEKFRAYNRKHPSWGALHSALEDFNLSNKDIDDHIEWARRLGDEESIELALILRSLTKTQRWKIVAKGRSQVINYQYAKPFEDALEEKIKTALRNRLREIQREETI